MLAVVHGDVSVHNLHGDLLLRFGKADARCFTSVVVGFACLNAADALQEGLLVHHHLIAGKVSEADVVYLEERQQEGIGGEQKERVSPPR